MQAPGRETSSLFRATRAGPIGCAPWLSLSSNGTPSSPPRLSD
jgi:hypothetical protein